MEYYLEIHIKEIEHNKFVHKAIKKNTQYT